MLRPEALKEARAAWEAGTLSTPEFKKVEDQAVDDAIAQQEAAGLDVVTDGELRRRVYVDSIAAAVEGVTRVSSPGQRVTWHGGEGGDEVDDWTLGVTAKIRPKRSIVTEEYTYARARATKPVKVTLPSPMTLALLRHPDHSPSVYDDVFDFFADVATVVRQEVAALVGLGCRYIQIDAPDLAKLVDDEGRAFYQAIGAAPERILPKASSYSTTSFGASTASPSASTCAEATGVAAGAARADTSPSRRRCSPARPHTTSSCSSTTTSVPDRSPHWPTCHKTRSPCSASSPPNDPNSSPSRSSRRGSAKPPATFRDSSSRSRHNAGSPANSPATRYPRPTRRRSCDSCPRSPAGPGCRASWRASLS